MTSSLQSEFIFERSPAREPAADEEPKVWKVAQLVRAARDTLEDGYRGIAVEGEISNFRRQTSGHCYFSLKDGDSQIACVMFRNNAVSAKADLADGKCVEVRGDLTIYEARGQMQIVVRSVVPRGAGALQAKFEALKAKLRAEGLFDSKRPLPRFPQRIGVVTSPTAAAFRDFRKVLRTRLSVELVIFPVRVQGAGAAAEIAAAVEYFSRKDDVQVVALIRGGGSIEDLWEFNEEIVARALAGCRIPTITGIGHEIDFTIADFVADFRAPTPSAAAMELVPAKADLREFFDALGNRLRRCVQAELRHASTQLAGLRRAAGFAEPLRRVRDYRQQLDAAFDDLLVGTRDRLRQHRQVILKARTVLQLRHPAVQLEMARARMADILRHASRSARSALEHKTHLLEKAKAELRAYSPQATLERGYSMTMAEDGTIIRDAAQAAQGSWICTRLAEGVIESRVQQSHPRKPRDRSQQRVRGGGC